MAKLFEGKKPKNLSKLLAEIEKKSASERPKRKAPPGTGYIWTNPPVPQGYLWDQKADFRGNKTQ